MRSPIAAPRHPRAAAGISAAALVAFLAAAFSTAAAAQPRLVFGNGEKPVARLPIGDHLTAGLVGAAPHAAYQLVLFDENGKPVAQAGGKTDAAGRLGPLLLWAHSGVVGCDRCAAPDAHRYRFRTFAEAAAALDGREFAVAAYGGNGEPAARRPLGLLATGGERPYFSDAEGCPRFSFPPLETVYLAFQDPDFRRPDRHFYLIANQEAGVAIGQRLDDVRDPGFPPVVDPGKPTVVWVPGKDDEGELNGVVTAAAPGLERVYQGGDFLIGPGGPKSSAGLSITVDTANCPPPPGSP